MKFVLLVAVLLAFFKPYACEYSPTIVPVGGGLSGSGETTRYWDCSKPSCGWVGNIRTNTSIPVTTCSIDGVTPIDPETTSGCEDGGSSYMCTNQSPYVVNSTLAYGYVAASFTGGADVHLCCACLLLSFQGELAGKQMLVQITNTGADLGVNQFDIAIPGGGVGICLKACSSQWNVSPTGWGERYGGVSSESECDELPGALQNGCRFRFEFMEGIPNPAVTFSQVKCPAELVGVTGCEL